MSYYEEPRPDVIIKDVTTEVWEVVEAVNTLQFDELCKTLIYLKFQQYVDHGYMCLMHEDAVVPIDTVTLLPGGVWYLRSRRAYVFENVDVLFRSLSEMFTDFEDPHDAVRHCVIKRQSIVKCMQKMNFKIDLNFIEESMMNL